MSEKFVQWLMKIEEARGDLEDMLVGALYDLPYVPTGIDEELERAVEASLENALFGVKSVGGELAKCVSILSGDSAAEEDSK